MLELWSGASYEPRGLSLLFAFAPVAMTIVIAYALAIRGAAALRGWLLVHFASLLPYAVCVTLMPSLVSPAAATAMFQIAGGFIPLAAAAGAGFQFGLLGRRGRTRTLVWVGVAAAVAWIPISIATTAVVADVRYLPAGLWYGNAGRWAWLALATTAVVSLPGFLSLAVVAVRSPPSDERRQLRLVLVANLVTYSGLIDVLLAYGADIFPLGWLLSGIGSLLVVRALIVEDLLRARAFDTTAPRLVLHLAVAVVLGATALAMFGRGVGWLGAAVILAIAFATARVGVAVFGLVTRWTGGGESTLDRLLGQLVQRSRSARTPNEVAQLAVDIIELGVGVRCDILLAAAEDWGWTTAAGKRLDDESAPDPLLVGWLVEERGAKFADEVVLQPEDLRPLLARLFERNAARTLVPVTSRDDLLALVVVPAREKALGGKPLAFLARACERLAESLVHVRMVKRAAEHAALAREMELAAAVQQQLLPGRQPHVHGAITVVGSWLPATRCAGDFWGFYPLAGGRVLVAIGDVTGHGVASATVTAAAAAACDVAVRRFGGELELSQLVVALDAAVRRVGAGKLSMSCFATIIDPTAGELRFVSCGHTTPYLCRVGAADKDIELHALVGRGNPLGGGGAAAPKVQQRALRAGDVVVWYTDGVVEAQDPAGEPFGDRRLQRMLKRLDRRQLAPTEVHDVVGAAVSAHRGNGPRQDDETLVVAQWRPAEAQP